MSDSIPQGRGPLRNFIPMLRKMNNRIGSVLQAILPLLLILAVKSPVGCQERTVGVFLNTPESFDGYTLFAPMLGATTYLIDNCGRVVNSWESDYRPGLAAYLLEDGSLLRTARLFSPFVSGGSGGRIEKISWEGNLTWSFNYSSELFNQHHDIAPLPNGNILVLAWEVVTPDSAIAAGRNPELIAFDELWPEHIIEIEPTWPSGGEIVWEWHLMDHIVQDFDTAKANYGDVSDHPELVDINYVSANGLMAGPDWIHANSIDYNAELDQILISTRNFSEIWVIDHSTTTEEAAGHIGGNSGRGGDLLYRWGNPEAYGRGDEADRLLYSQHDARWVVDGHPDEGKITVFNNGVGRPNANFSSVEILQPAWNEEEFQYELRPDSTYRPEISDWSYAGDTEFQFFSTSVSGAVQLPNGNLLVCIGTYGHFIEVDREGTMVWEYINPVSGGAPIGQGQPIFANNVFKIERYSPDYPGLQGRDLSPGAVIELNPLPSDCSLYPDTSTVSIEEPGLEGVLLISNPVINNIRIQNSRNTKMQYNVFDGTGRLIQQLVSSDQLLDFNVGHFASGIMYVSALELHTGRSTVFKVLKL